MIRSIRFIFRNLWFYLWFVPLTLFFMSLAVVVRPLCPSGRWGAKCGNLWTRMLLVVSGVRVDVDLSEIPRDQTVILVPNHQSQLDILLMYALFPDRHVCFVAKESLFRIPLFGPALRAAGNVSIDRDNPKKAMKAINTAMERVQSGVSVIIFPEGTRSKAGGDLLPFQIGAAVMALKCEVPVVPIIIRGAGEIMPKGVMCFPAGPKPIKVRALPAIEAGRYHIKQREQFKDDLYELMNNAYKEMLP